MIGFVLVDRTGVLNALRRTAVAMFARSGSMTLFATLDQQQALTHLDGEESMFASVVWQGFH